MLAQNFKTASALGLTADQQQGLCRTLVMLETEKLSHEPFNNDWPLGHLGKFTGHFNMATWGRAAPCGTVACIGGTAEILGAQGLASVACRNSALRELFEPADIDPLDWEKITPTQAATALRSYLTTGDARWDLAVQT